MRLYQQTPTSAKESVGKNPKRSGVVLPSCSYVVFVPDFDLLKLWTDTFPKPDGFENPTAHATCVFFIAKFSINIKGLFYKTLMVALDSSNSDLELLGLKVNN